MLFEDNHLIIINKKPSDIVQGDKTGDIPMPELLKNFLKEKYQKPGNVFVGVIHRLDRPVSGAVIFAKTSKALTRMNKLIQDGGLTKKYWAIVENMPISKTGTLINFLKKNEKQNKSYVVQESVKGSKRAELNYKFLAASQKYYLIEVELITGRHHQIRAQLSSIGCIIKGDLKYGAKRTNADASICLHSREIKFIHPIKNELVHILAPPPDNNIWNIF
ncbi:MAG: RNA pseudouridine synthase [Bacteroidetes bacterium CG2_30_33_31]|nr:MAG: RNA pseudouridine synthase [Bacteroidetes bacterium CG2_30_33_31]